MSDRHQLVELLDDLDNGTYGTISGVADRLRDALAEQERTVSLDPWEKVALAMAHLSAGEDTAALELLRAALAQRDREAMSSIRAEMIRSGDIKAES